MRYQSLKQRAVVFANLQRQIARIGERTLRMFVLSAAILFGLSGMAKMWTVFGSSKLLLVIDPLIGVSFKHLMLAAGTAELVIAGACVLCESLIWRIALVAWLSSSIVLYRVGLWAAGWRKPCGCLGDLANVLGISDNAADLVMMGVLAYLFASSAESVG